MIFFVTKLQKNGDQNFFSNLVSSVFIFMDPICTYTVHSKAKIRKKMQFWEASTKAKLNFFFEIFLNE